MKSELEILPLIMKQLIFTRFYLSRIIDLWLCIGLCFFFFLCSVRKFKNRLTPKKSWKQEFLNFAIRHAIESFASFTATAVKSADSREARCRTLETRFLSLIVRQASNQLDKVMIVCCPSNSNSR